MDPGKALSVWNIIYVIALASTVIATVFVNVYSRRVSSDANQRIAEVELESERIRNENSQLQLQVERERTERLRLEEAVAPRRLGKDSGDLISDFLSNHPPETLEIAVFIGTDDGIPFAVDIHAAFQAGGWVIGDGAQTTGYGNVRGLSVVVKDWATAPNKAQIAARALEHGGLAINRVSDADLEDDSVLIVISPKR